MLFSTTVYAQYLAQCPGESYCPSPDKTKGLSVFFNCLIVLHFEEISAYFGVNTPFSALVERVVIYAGHFYCPANTGYVLESYSIEHIGFRCHHIYRGSPMKLIAGKPTISVSHRTSICYANT